MYARYANTSTIGAAGDPVRKRTRKIAPNTAANCTPNAGHEIR
jgi:hypothetical protein